ncbi:MULTISPECIES: hypothetical protein [Bacillaceae]|uniref:hypothetical protein n=1 Tax=Bacillaceae TaxID=186817 RepID=UPI0012DD63DD|nr:MULTISPECIES: hypothetical protein [Bacillaceae]
MTVSSAISTRLPSVKLRAVRQKEDQFQAAAVCFKKRLDAYELCPKSSRSGQMDNVPVRSVESGEMLLPHRPWQRV